MSFGIEKWVAPKNFPMGRFAVYCTQIVVRTYDGVLNLSEPSKVIDEKLMGTNIGLLITLEFEIGCFWKPLSWLTPGKKYSLKTLGFCQFAKYAGSDDYYAGAVFMRTPTGFVNLARHKSTWDSNCPATIEPLPLGTTIKLRFKNGGE